MAPFDLAILCLILGALCTLCWWTENYGSRDGTATGVARGAVALVLKEEPVLLLGLIQALFEGAMYTFVFLWTPTLEAAAAPQPIPHGLIFAIFMMSTSLGARVFVPLTSTRDAASVLPQLFLLSAMSLAIPALLPSPMAPILLAFCVFECCVGVFWPLMMRLRAAFVPDELRATMINFYRVPLNVIVVGTLLLQHRLTTRQTFGVCVGELGMAGVLGLRLRSMARTRAPTPPPPPRPPRV